MPEKERLSQTETRAYDSFQRMTSMTTFGGGTIAYNYSQTANDGKIVSQTSGAETINYNYDSLGRLTQATTAGTDGWGNRLTQNAVKGAVPTMVTITDPATNRIQSHTYDANGNTTNPPQQGAMTYDVMNRLKTVASDTYGYDPANKRIWKNDEYTFYGAGGERIGRYSATKLVNDTGTHVFVFQKVHVDEYFGGRRLTTQDRLGSVGSYYPYGESRSGTVSNADSFATYYRDSTGLDYANQRYYAAGAGRFITADPYQASAGTSDPASWNRYAYVRGEPIGRIDPEGLADFSVTVYASLSSFGGGGGGFFGGNNGASWVWHEDNEVLWGYDRQLTLSYFAPESWAGTLLHLERMEGISAMGISDECLQEIRKAGVNPQTKEALTTSNIQTAASSVKLNSGALPEVSVEFADPTHYAWTPIGENYIFWRPGYYGLNRLERNWIGNTLLHEILHTIGYTDKQLQEAFYGPAGVDANNTDNITEHLAKHCLK